MPTIKKTRVEFEGRVEEREVIVEPQHIDPWDREAQLALVGQPMPRVDGVARVTGQAVYTSDVQPAGMLVGRILRSPHPHARVVAVDSSAAEKMAGVWLVWHRQQPAPVARVAGQTIFPEEVGQQGEPVAFVVARDERAAERALSAIHVTYDELPFVPDREAALAEDAPAVLTGLDNRINPEGEVYERGDVERGLQEADAVVEITFTTPVTAHCCMETHGSVARWEGDQVTLWHSTQGVFAGRSSLADALDMPYDDVRVICEYVGGGFGSKSNAEDYSVLAALAARETSHPVRVVLDRREEQLVAGNRPDSRQRVRLGARRDGTLTLIEQQVWQGMGTYATGTHVVDGPARDLYACPNVRTVVWGVRTNGDTARAFRAPGYVEGTVPLEGAMDALAEKLGLDPLDLRLKNYAEGSPQRGVPYTSKGLREAYVVGAERFGWAERDAQPRERGPWRRGWGMASQIWGGGGGPPANAIVKLLPDGTAEVLVGVQDIGTGTRTVLAQVAAEELGLPIDAVRVVIGDTLPTPYGPTSGGSVTLASTTPAVREAAHQALTEFLALAAYMLDVPDAPAEEFIVSDGAITYRQNVDMRIRFAEVAAKMDGYTVVGNGGRGPNPEDKAINTFGAHFAEVEVNVETGQVCVLRIVAAHDIGRVVNPLTAISQVYGGVTMGLGFALTEERVIDHNTGLQLTANLEDYKVPVVTDLPEIDVVFVGEADPEANPVGSKGLGEPPIVPPAAAIANAVSDALGVRITELPITPDRVLRALARREEVAS
jgi:xanthine dehydrogenase YagR molybdenum-binding subunit